MATMRRISGATTSSTTAGGTSARKISTSEKVYLAQIGKVFGPADTDGAMRLSITFSLLLPMMCGLGGDGFAVVYDARRREVLGLNGSGVAGAGATAAVAPFFSYAGLITCS